MDSLLQELVEIVLDFTNFHSDFTTMKILLFVCRAWHTLMTTKLIRDKPITIHGKYYKLANLMKLFRYNKKLSYYASGFNVVSIRQLGNAKLMNLQELVINNSCLDPRWIKALPSLRKIIIESASCHDIIINIRLLSQIHELTLCRIRIGATYNTVSLNTLKGLKILNLMHLSHHILAITSLNGLGNLEELNMEGVDNITGLQLIYNLPSSIRRIRMRKCSFMKFEFNISEAMFDIARERVLLELLEIHSCTNLDEKIIAALVNNTCKVIYS